MPKATVNSAGYSAYNETLAAQEIQAAKGNGSDYVIVYMHYGNEYSRSPNEAQKNISHQCIDNGADIVIGSHTHVTQGVEMYKGKPIFYNLGNFIFDQSNSATHRAYFLNIQLVNDTAEVTMYPINLVGYLPQFMSPEDGTELLEELNPQCSDVIITPQGTGKLELRRHDYEGGYTCCRTRNPVFTGHQGSAEGNVTSLQQTNHTVRGGRGCGLGNR